MKDLGVVFSASLKFDLHTTGIVHQPLDSEFVIRNSYIFKQNALLCKEK